ncbi:MAG: PAS domain-containing protein, partial [Chloroflexaceae bacterium]|nr:PAS domain-containing protein [Chloroflexaceae bacterium]
MELTASSTMGVWDVDLQTGTNVWSASLFEILGYDIHPAGTATSAMWERCIHPDDREQVQIALEVARRTHTPYALNHRIIRADTGAVVWLNVGGRFLYDDTGMAARFVGIVCNVTEHQQAEEALRESRHFLASIVEAVPSLIYVYDMRTHQNVYTNNRLKHLFGYTAAEVAQVETDIIKQLLHPDDLENLEQWLEQIKNLRDDETFEVTYRMQHKDGSWRWVSGRDSVFKRLPDGQVWQVLGVLEDITERKQTEAHLQESIYRLQIASDAGHIGIYDYDLVNNRILW